MPLLGACLDTSVWLCNKNGFVTRKTFFSKALPHPGLFFFLIPNTSVRQMTEAQAQGEVACSVCAGKCQSRPTPSAQLSSASLSTPPNPELEGGQRRWQGRSPQGPAFLGSEAEEGSGGRRPGDAVPTCPGLQRCRGEKQLQVTVTDVRGSRVGDCACTGARVATWLAGGSWASHFSNMILVQSKEECVHRCLWSSTPRGAGDSRRTWRLGGPPCFCGFSFFAGFASPFRTSNAVCSFQVSNTKARFKSQKVSAGLHRERSAFGMKMLRENKSLPVPLSAELGALL